MNYTNTLDFLFTQLPMFQRSGPAAYKNSLNNTLALDKYYGYPHKQFKTIHVAGTNGKGSVSHMLAAILQTAGYKTGLYTSPHLKDFRERIRTNGRMIPEQEVIKWVKYYRQYNEEWKLEPSFFELTVAMAFDYFAQQKVDIAIIEVGLGGRLDSTNIITPEVSIITNIGLDHTDLLGDTIGKIAFEKAGIIKKNVPAVIGKTQPETIAVFESVAKEKKARLFFADQEYNAEYSLMGTDGKQIFNIEKNGKIIYPELKLDLTGNYQKYNLPTVLRTIDLLLTQGWKINNDHVYKGLENTNSLTGFQGRWQIIGHNPLIICDTGHNEDGIKEIVKQLQNMAYKQLHIVFGTVGDKNPDQVLKLLPQNAKYYFTKADIPRALDEKILTIKAAEYGLKGKSFNDVKVAFKQAKENADTRDLIFVGGSNFVVAEVL
ncbi:MAG: bifunctional folylpolyglutamate synthase/dihydrofolate synthase [Prolixibacteraceae bacterium]|nr:bifunctional folylpolyglutamate synthase/dihydrofolate synthase [Prolixibacteraceae bacterium]